MKSFVSIILVIVFVACSSDGTSPTGENDQGESGYFAVTGSYSTSFQLPILEFVKKSVSPLPDHFVKVEEQIRRADEVAALIDKERPESVFTTGDNNYKAGCHSTIDINIGRLYHRYIGNYTGGYGKGASTNRFFPILGNHDVLVYEAYLVRNGLSITLGHYGSDGDETDTYRFSKESWVQSLRSLLGSEESSETLIQSLIDGNLFDSRSVSLDDGSTGTAYWPKRAIVLSDLNEKQQTAIKNAIKNLIGNTSVQDSVIESLAEQLLYQDFNVYCILEEDIGPTFPYVKYFTLPGNERYYKVSKEHDGTKVDFFVLNINITFNSLTGHEPDGNTRGSAQYQWFVREAAASSANFKIALVHDEPYTSFEGNNDTVIGWNLEKYMDVVLSGDIQAYERHSIRTEHGKAWFLSVGVGGLALEEKKPGSRRFFRQSGLRNMAPCSCKSVPTEWIFSSKMWMGKSGTLFGWRGDRFVL